jgi:UDP-N-acetylglucosamine 2-epimerase (non-hydrolysing)
MSARIHLIAGARPNFMKVAPLWHELARHDGLDVALIHTGQHYDDEMSDIFLRQFGLPQPHYALGAGGGSHAEQTAAVMTAYERVCVADRPDWVVVVGDVNSTMAATIVAKKLVLPVAHLEAGLRSFDRTMPEEINRLVTDALADLLWTPSPDADANLAHEGVPAEKIERVGNIMIDAYVMLRDQIAAADWPGRNGLSEAAFAVMTLHRPANVDDPERLAALVRVIEALAKRIALVLPLHPRTRRRLDEARLLGRLEALANLRLTAPLGYVEFMSAVGAARFVLTDSGGVQEETTYLGVPCLTLRDTTERPITVTQGSNRLVTLATVPPEVDRVLAGARRIGKCPELWDGATARRVAASLLRRLSKPADVPAGASLTGTA